MYDFVLPPFQNFPGLACCTEKLPNGCLSLAKEATQEHGALDMQKIETAAFDQAPHQVSLAAAAWAMDDHAGWRAELMGRLVRFDNLGPSEGFQD